MQVELLTTTVAVPTRAIVTTCNDTAGEDERKSVETLIVFERI